MNVEDAEEYTQALGQIVAGSWRQIALAKRLGVPKALGLSVEQWVNDKLGGYAKIDAADRRPAALELKANGYTTRESGEILGVDHATIVRDLGANAPAGDKNDKENSGPSGEAGANAPVDAMAALAAAPGRGKPIFTGETEWYTPAPYIALVREVLSEIDLDPASSDLAQETVKAKAYFTAADDGLSKEWRGNVFLNPPYKQPDIFDFVQKLVDEAKAGRVGQAILLVNNSTDTEWFHLGAKHCSAICFTRGRINFVDKHGNTGSPALGSAFLYFGNLPLQFKAVFETIGFVKM